jgi:hypothetical protein
VRLTHLSEKSATGFAGESFANPETVKGNFLSPGERIKGEGERYTIIQRKGLCRRPTLPIPLPNIPLTISGPARE